MKSISNIPLKAQKQQITEESPSEVIISILYTSAGEQRFLLWPIILLIHSMFEMKSKILGD